jgi:DNA helicase-2/ATP-dependent DNA helicase PcrA
METNNLSLTPGAWNDTKLKGVNAYRLQVSKLIQGQRLFLEREPENQYDSQAICVKTRQGDVCGYISKDIAVNLAPVLDQYGKNLEASVIEILTANVKDSNTGVRIRFQIPGSQNKPVPVKEMDISRLSSKIITDEQKAIILHPDGKHARVLAVAGSGKTETMVMRIKHLVEDINVNPDSIQVLMFNRNIKLEFQERLNRPGEGVPGMAQRVNTFHSLASIIRRYAENNGYDNSRWIPWDMDEEPGINLSTEKISIILLNLIKALEKTCEIPLNSVGAEEAEDAIRAWKNALIKPEHAGHRDNPALVKVYRAFEKYRLDNSGLTFDDFVPMAVSYLESFTLVNQRYCSGLRYIFVDEYQDVNYAQQRLIELLAGKQADVMVIGDDDQTLYEWRGARPDYILHKFGKQFDNKVVETYQLTNSFRFGPLIAQCAENSVQWNKKREEKSVVAYQIDKLADIQVMEEGELEHKNSNLWLKEQVMNLLKLKLAKPDEIIVLCRMYAQLSLLEAEFIGQIPYIVSGQSPFYKRHESAALLDYLRVGLNYRKPISKFIRKSFLSIANFPNRRLTKSELENLSEAALNNGLSLAEVLERFLEDPRSLFRESQKVSLNDLMTSLQGVFAFTNGANSQTAAEVLEWIKERVKIVSYLEERYGKGQPSFDRIEAMENFIMYARERMMKTEAFLDHIDRLDTTLGTEKNKCIVMTTVYQAKGKQYPYVIIPNCNEGYMPSRYEISNGVFDVTGKVQEADLSESIENERRLFYVALTRATKGIFIGASSPDGERSLPSRFLDEIELDETKKGLASMQKIISTQRENPGSFIGDLSGIKGSFSLAKNAQKYIENIFGKEIASKLDGLVSSLSRKLPGYRTSETARKTLAPARPVETPAEKDWWDD